MGPHLVSVNPYAEDGADCSTLRTHGSYSPELETLAREVLDQLMETGQSQTVVLTSASKLTPVPCFEAVGEHGLGLVVRVEVERHMQHSCWLDQFFSCVEVARMLILSRYMQACPLELTLILTLFLRYWQLRCLCCSLLVVLGRRETPMHLEWYVRDLYACSLGICISL